MKEVWKTEKYQSAWRSALLEMHDEEAQAKRSNSMRKEWKRNRRNRVEAAVRGGEVRRERYGETYVGVHLRLKHMLQKGLLEKETCSKKACSKLAQEWALLHGRETHYSFRGNSVLGYSLRAEDYVAMCVTCHREYDKRALSLRRKKEIRRRREAGELLRSLALDFDIPMRRVQKICGETWLTDNEKEGIKEHEMLKTSKKTKGFTLVELMIVVAIIGILAAIAIPAFMKNAKKAKTTEATLNIKKIQEGAISYYHEEHVKAGSAVPIARQFPDTPAVPVAPAAGACCPNKCAPNNALWVDPSWQALKFGLSDAHYYSYSYDATTNGVGTTPLSGTTVTTLADGTTPNTFFFAGAYGDLNCNGVFSTFEMFGAIDGTNNITTSAGMYSNLELE